MFSLIPKTMSPVKVAYYGCRFTAILNREGRPWSLLIITYHLLLLINLAIFGVLEILLDEGTIQDISQTVSLIAVSVHVFGKAINAFIRQKEIEALLEKLENVRCEIFNESEHKIILIKSDIFYKKLITMLLMFCSIFPVASLVVNFLADYMTQSEIPHLSFRVYVPWSMKEFWPYMAGMFGVWLFPVTTSSVYTSFCLLQITFAVQISAFSKILQARMEQHGPDIRNIKDHVRINSLILEYNKIFSAQIYLEIVITCVQQCGFGFPLIKLIKNHDLSALDLMYKWFYALLSPYIICTCGQEISTQVEKLHHSLYMSNWYEKKPKERGALLMMNTITLNPTTVNFKKFIFFNFVCFTTVVQGIYSYIAMLINLDR